MFLTEETSEFTGVIYNYMSFYFQIGHVKTK